MLKCLVFMLKNKLPHRDKIKCFSLCYFRTQIHFTVAIDFTASNGECPPPHHHSYILILSYLNRV